MPPTPTTRIGIAAGGIRSLKLASSAKFGNYLVDGNGRTLYLFALGPARGRRQSRGFQLRGLPQRHDLLHLSLADLRRPAPTHVAGSAPPTSRDYPQLRRA